MSALLAAQTTMPAGLVVLLFIVGFCLVLMEILTPGVLIGLIGTGMMVTSIFFAFRDHGTGLAIGLMAVAVIFVPAIFIWTLRRITLKSDLRPEDGYVSVPENLTGLVGQRGTSLTPLRPAGRIRIGGKKLDVVSQVQFIEPDRPVEVVQVEGARVVVREVPDGEAPPQS